MINFFCNFPFLYFLVFSKINENIASIGQTPLYKEGKKRERGKGKRMRMRKKRKKGKKGGGGEKKFS